MKIIMRALLLFLLISPTAYSQRQESEAYETTITTHQPEQLLRSLHQQGELFAFTIESLIDDIQHHVVHTNDNDTAVAELKILHSTIQTCLNQPILTVDEHVLTNMIDTLTHALENFENGVINTFYGWRATPWQAIPPITRSQHIKTYAEISEQQEIIAHKLAAIQNKVQYVGLSSMRTWYRACCNGLAHIHINTISTRKFLIAGALVSWLYFTRNMPRRGIDNILRYPNNTEVDPAQLNLFLRTIDWLNTSWGIDLTPSKWNVPIPIILMEYSLKDEVVRTHAWLTKKIRKAHYYLKGRRPPKDSVKTYPTRGFEEIRGNEHNKKDACKLIEYLVDHERFTQKNIPFQHGMLLLGKTRSGKTFFAEKFCGELNKRRVAQGLSPCPFIQVDAGKIYTLEGWEKGLKGYIDLAREEAPCILFIDELHHLVQGDRKTLTELLTGMSGAFQDGYERPIIIMAATNHPEMIDQALRQKGRFGIELLFEYPPFHERREHLSRELQATFLELSAEQLDALAYETEKCAYDDLNELIAYMKQEANINKKSMSRELLEEALDKIIRKIKTPEIKLDQETKHVVAIHQASHIIAIKKLSPHKIITKATMAPIEIKTDTDIATQLGGVFSYAPYESPASHNPTRLVADCKELLAGHVGEVVFFGTSTYAYQQETEKALALCKQLSSKGITATNDATKKIQADLMRDAIALKNTFEQELFELLSKKKTCIETVAHALEHKETLTQQEIAALIKEAT